MKKLIMALLLCIATPVQASSNDAELCHNIGNLAASIMKARQQGIDKDRVLLAIDPRSPAANLAETLVDIAYSKPIMVTVEAKRDSIDRFALETELVCLK